MDIQRPVMSNLCYRILGRCLLIVCQVPLQLGQMRKALHLTLRGDLIESLMNPLSGLGEAGGNYLPNGRCPTLFGLLFPTVARQRK